MNAKHKATSVKLNLKGYINIERATNNEENDSSSNYLFYVVRHGLHFFLCHASRMLAREYMFVLSI